MGGKGDTLKMGISGHQKTKANYRITDKGPISSKELLQINKRENQLKNQTTKTDTLQKLYEKVLHHILSFISKTQTKTKVGYPTHQNGRDKEN